MTRLASVLRNLNGGAAKSGWVCRHCHKRFRHNGHPLRTYTQLTGHMLARHHKLPEHTGQTLSLHTFTWSRQTAGGAS